MYSSVFSTTFNGPNTANNAIPTPVHYIESFILLLLCLWAGLAHTDDWVCTPDSSGSGWDCHHGRPYQPPPRAPVRPRKTATGPQAVTPIPVGAPEKTAEPTPVTSTSSWDAAQQALSEDSQDQYRPPAADAARAKPPRTTTVQPGPAFKAPKLDAAPASLPAAPRPALEAQAPLAKTTEAPTASTAPAKAPRPVIPPPQRTSPPPSSPAGEAEPDTAQTSPQPAPPPVQTTPAQPAHGSAAPAPTQPSPSVAVPTPAPKTTPIFDASAAPSDVTRAELAPEPGSADAKTIDAGITDTIAAQAYDSVVYALGPAKSGIRTSPWTLCPNYLPPDQVKAIVDQPQDPDAPLDIHADNSQTFQQQLSVFTGNVSLQQDKRKLHADTLRYDMETDRAEAAGNLFIEDRGWKIWADRGTWDFAANQGQLDNAHFEYLGNHSRGTASSADFEGTKVSHFTDATYTNCPAGIDDWALKAKHLTLDRPADTGTARHATFSFKGVPILYTPYLSFPLSDKRKTGLLTPIVGYNSNDGLDVTVPFYWNIAPNYDATIAARYMNDRGIQGQGEFRYLFPSGKQRGSIAGEYLPNDSSYQDDDRWAVSFKHEGELAPNLSTDISLASASDKDYFNDLGNSLHVASTPNLERRIDLTYQTRDWRFRTRVQEYQILDKDLSSADKPYERKPQFLFDTKRPLRAGPVELDMRAQMDNFDHSDKNAKDTGSRVDLEPGISLPTVGLAGFFTPRVALRHTKYYLEEAGSGHDKTHPSRTLPVASIDSGLFFEKDLNWGGHAMVHSIEPRLYYLYIPNKNQDDIPRFDTIEPDFSATQLFQDNRFTGGDRIGDANQLTTAVTTRLLDSESGRQRLAVSLGQIRYFRDRKVTLNPGEKANDDSSSDIVFGLNALPYGHWSLTSNWLWDPHKKQTTTHHSRLFYKRDRDHILNFSYRFRRDGNNTFDDGNKNRDDDLEQTDISGIWRLASNWKAVGRWNWSISDKKTLEVLGGLQYDSCCWNLLMVYREFVQNNDGDTQQGVYLQFTLKGLTRVGHNVDKLLARGILGYEPEDIK